MSKMSEKTPISFIYIYIIIFIIIYIFKILDFKNQHN